MRTCSFIQALRAFLFFVVITPWGAALAQTAPPPPPCGGAEFHQLDFWLGDWDVRWDATPAQPAGRGTNRVTRDLGDCVIHEHFNGAGLIGESWSLYHAPSRRWRQTWVDNQGGYFALSGGRENDKFVLVSRGVDDNQPRQRMVFENITPQNFTWRWQRTTDGGTTWSDAWVIFYTRRSATEERAHEH